MISWFIADNHSGRIYVLATLLPLAVFTLLLLGGLIRTLARPYRRDNSIAAFFYFLFGGDKPLKAGAYVATGAIGIAAILAMIGLVRFLADAGNPDLEAKIFKANWEERTTWLQIGPIDPEATPKPAIKLEFGYRIDHLTAILFAMVTGISTCIFVFSIGYMRDETQEKVTDHEVHVAAASHDAHGHGHDNVHGHSHGGHLERRGRYGRFFLYLSLFCFSMLNLLIADNLFQIFISWELVGVCSFFLIGFYYERLSASTAANKAFIMNRIGDAGLLIGLGIVWTYFGTFNFQEIFQQVRAPALDAHDEPVKLGGSIVRFHEAELPDRRDPTKKVAALKIDQSAGPRAILFHADDHIHGDQLVDGVTVSSRTAIGKTKVPSMPYYLLVIAGLGIFLGCVGKSAQFPLHTWLPDAMEGPTPVSALIHAATMVAAGVYLVGRAFPIFTPEVLLVIAYTGAITLFLAATIALVQTDIKRVLAYSTVSQLGYMMLALGVGGWTPGLLHLLTHAFFKALMFLAAGAVIFGLHHEQDLRKMGGLRKKMPITAYTMLVGVLAIVGTPLFSGWYSKDQIIGQALGFGLTHPQHILLTILPLVTAVLTGFYMFRLWFLAFGGTPRDQHVYEHATEAPLVMTIPLMILALFSVGVGWGAEFWSAEGSYVGHLLEKAEPAAVKIGFAKVIHSVHEHHMLAGLLALVAAALGVGIATWMYGLQRSQPASVLVSLVPIHTFLMKKWYFDELYNLLFVMPIVKLAFCIGRFDKRTAKPEDADAADKRVDPSSVDGVLSALGLLMYSFGLRMRAAQSGLLRRYILVLVLTTVVMFAILSFLAT